MSDILEELAGEIRKSRGTFDHRNKPSSEVIRSQAAVRRQTVAPQRFSSNFVKARGPGGLVFDFGPRTGNPIADGATALLNQFADPIQAQIVRDQRNAFNKALMEHVTGEQEQVQEEHRAAVVSGLIHDEWNKQLGKSFDQQTAEMVKKQGLGESGEGLFVQGDFNKSTMDVGGEQAVAQSETDAAVIEMMKAEMARGESDGTGR